MLPAVFRYASRAMHIPTVYAGFFRFLRNYACFIAPFLHLFVRLWAC